jgi:hypothetical protein
MIYMYIVYICTQFALYNVRPTYVQESYSFTIHSNIATKWQVWTHLFKASRYGWKLLLALESWISSFSHSNIGGYLCHIFGVDARPQVKIWNQWDRPNFPQKVGKKDLFFCVKKEGHVVLVCVYAYLCMYQHTYDRA